MKTTTENKPKRGTIGYEVAKLVKRYGHYCAGLTILEMAVREATKTEYIKFDFNGQTGYLSQTPGFQNALISDRADLARYGCVFYDEQRSVAYKYVNAGTDVVAIRFAPGMTKDAMIANMENNPPTASDWRKYDTNTNAFIS